VHKHRKALKEWDYAQHIVKLKLKRCRLSW